MEIVKTHNHQPDFGGVKAKKLIAQAKQRFLEEPNLLPAVVSRDTFSNADDETLLALPRESSIKASLRRLRRRDNPRLPTSLEELVDIPEKYKNVGGDL